LPILARPHIYRLYTVNVMKMPYTLKYRVGGKHGRKDESNEQVSPLAAIPLVPRLVYKGQDPDAWILALVYKSWYEAVYTENNCRVWGHLLIRIVITSMYTPNPNPTL
jgi:hypothetical protein